MGADCYSQDFTSFEDVGSFYFGILSSESDCAVACEAVPDCAAYEYHTANYTCYGREEIGMPLFHEGLMHQHSCCRGGTGVLKPAVREWLLH